MVAGGYNGPVSFIIPVKDKINTYLIGVRESVGVVIWDGCTAETSIPIHRKVIDKTPGVRLNDAKADRSGRLWLGKCNYFFFFDASCITVIFFFHFQGTMAMEIKGNPGNYNMHQGTLFSLENDGTVVERLNKVSVSNGLAWSLDDKVFYFIDTYKFAVEAYDFDIISGNICESVATSCKSFVS